VQITTRHRKVARAIWEAGGRLDEAAESARAHTETLHRWLADPDFRALVAQEAFESLFQATSAAVRWAPAAVARLIRDLDSESVSGARLAAREILKLATETHRALAGPADSSIPAGPMAPGAIALLADDPLAQRVSRLTDTQVAQIFAILENEA